jgi:hypothetical protein
MPVEKQMKKIALLLCLVLIGMISFSSTAMAQGISVDAGMTPGEDRWMFRTMVHQMNRGNDPGPMGQSMRSYKHNNVLAYGFRRNLTLIFKMPVLYRQMTMAGTTMDQSGRSDSTVAVKYSIYRRNTMAYTLAIASTLGVKLPSGVEPVYSETLDLQPGLYLSMRFDRWASDLALEYSWNGLVVNRADKINPGNELAANWALAYRYSLGDSGNIAYAPVLEFTYKNIAANSLSGDALADSGESVLYLSPGIKLTVSSLVLEALLQVPVWQQQTGMQLERGNAVLAGIRYMF